MKEIAQSGLPGKSVERIIENEFHSATGDSTGIRRDPADPES